MTHLFSIGIENPCLIPARRYGLLLQETHAGARTPTFLCGETSLKIRSVAKPLLFVDVDGVLSIYGFDPDRAAGEGSWQMVDGIIHVIAHGSGERLIKLAEHFELVWATGWGERANDFLISLLGLGGRLPVIEFEVRPSTDGSGHWKLDGLSNFEPDMPAAWIDDGHNDACHEWASRRSAPTLLITTDPAKGLLDSHVEQLLVWADSLNPRSKG